MGDPRCQIDDKWNAMCQVMGNPNWSKDKKFSDQYNRWQNQDELNKLIAGWTKEFTHYEMMHKLQKSRGSSRRISRYRRINQ